VKNDPKTLILVDLENQLISVEETEYFEKFDINPYKKLCLQNGYDDIDYLVSIKDKIEAYEAKRTTI